MLTTNTGWQCYHKIVTIDYTNHTAISYVPHLCTIEHKADNTLKLYRSIFTCTDSTGRAVYGVGLWSPACWDWCFESRRRHGCLSVCCDCLCDGSTSSTE
jgi:hypothetical protein